MRQEDWNAKEFVERVITGDGDVVEILADLSPDQLTEVELILAKRDPHQ
jgi:hypothetical protein